MSVVNDLVIASRQRGIVMAVEGGALRVDGPDETLTDDLLAEIKAHKTDILAALQNALDAEDLKEYLEERAGILEYDGGLSRPDAESEAVKITSTYARNRNYAWQSLRSAFEGYPEILAQLPDKAGPVDSLPLGLAKLAVIGKRVVRQGAFTTGPSGTRL